MISFTSKLVITWQIGLIAAVLGLAPLPGYASESDSRRPAVKALNGEVWAAYLFDGTDRKSGVPSDATSISNAWQLGGSLTVPVTTLFGLRLGLDGGQRYGKFEDPQSITRIDYSTIETGADLFWRDPELGSLEFRYAFHHQISEIVERQSSILSAITPGKVRTSSHSFGARGQVYLGMVDLVANGWFSPRTIDLEATQDPSKSDTKIEQVDVTVGPRVYLADALAVSATFRWHQTEFPTAIIFGGGSVQWFAARSQTYLGGLGVDIQLPTGAQRPVIMGLQTEVGQRGTNYESPFSFGSDRDDLIYRVGVSLEVVYPFPASLREWYREYH